MSIYRYHGLCKPKGGIIYYIGEQMKKLSLIPVQRISYTFDPFHPSSGEFRKLMFYLSSPRVRETNYDCRFKTEVVCDNSEPLMLCKLVDGRQIRFEAANLTSLEILERFNQIVLPLVPEPESLNVVEKKTKSQRKK